MDAPDSFQPLGVGSNIACPDPDNAGLKTSSLSDTNADGRNDLCTQSGYQTKGIDGDREYHARVNSTTPAARWCCSVTTPTRMAASISEC